MQLSANGDIIKGPKKEGVRFENATEILSASEHIRPLRDHILVRPAEWEPSKVIQVAGNQRKTLRGTVVAVGPGRFPIKYNATRSKSWLSNTFLPTQVKPGDFIELGGLEIDGYSFPQVLIDNVLHVIATERDVCGIVE